jgi:hypothetical protein
MRLLLSDYLQPNYKQAATIALQRDRLNGLFEWTLAAIGGQKKPTRPLPLQGFRHLDKSSTVHRHPRHFHSRGRLQ